MDEQLAITIWKDGSWKVWRRMDAAYAQSDPDWLSTIGAAELNRAIATEIPQSPTK